MLENAIVTAPITANARARSVWLRRGACARTAMESGLARSNEPARPAASAFACRTGSMSEVTVDPGSESTPLVPRTPPHDVELVRALCERILRQNWREGAMPDGTPFAYTAPSLGHYPWQFYWDSCFTGDRLAAFRPPSAHVANSSRCSPPQRPTASSGTRSSGTRR